VKIVLHICCGVCAAGAAQELISEGHTVTGYYFNPNIYPEEEYKARLEAAQKIADELGFEFKTGEYAPKYWTAETMALAAEPEGRKRCEICYRIRLQAAHEFMKETGADAFASTLTIGPSKSAEKINRIGFEIGGETFLARDFKKKDGFKKANELSKKLGIYRQNYCGCIYSIR
jgi:predicted adenine nucleotide alpha hydrolase (AANH) superfamily ATPase